MENNNGINQEMAKGILQSINFSLSPNSDERKLGETSLANAAKMGGFITTIFQLIVTDELNDHYKQFLAVYLKNSIQKSWAPTKYDSKTDSKIKLPSAYSNDEQTLIRDNLLTAILRSPSSIQSQLHLVFKYIVEADFPEKWPSLLGSLKTLLTSQHLPSTETSLVVTRILFRKYEYSEKDRQVIYGLVDELFPILIQLFNFTYATPNNQSFGHIFLYLCKIFYTVTHIELPPHLYSENNMLNWMNLLMGLFTRQISEEEQPQNNDRNEKKNYVWWKIKKWTIKIFTRLFATYGDPSSSSDPHEKEHNLFSQRFHQIYAGKILNATLSVLAPIRQKSFVPDIVITHCFQYINNSLRYASTYTTLKPNLQIFLQEILFPVLCFSEDDKETWEDDPIEFVRKEFDVIEEYYSPKKTAENLIHRLFSTRNRSNLILFLQFINDLLNRFAATAAESRNYIEKDGALTVLGVLASTIMDIPEFKENLQSFVGTYILPEFDSPAGFLRAKACWAFGIYAPKLGNELVVKGLEKTIACMMDGQLPVRVNAAVSLRFFIVNDFATEMIGNDLGTIFELYLKLIGEVEIDELISTLETIINEYKEKIGPFATALVSSLLNSFYRIINESENDPEKDNCLAALEILRAISIILEAIRSCPQIYFDLEKLITPLLIHCMSDHYLEYFEDLMKVISYLSFFIPEIPRSMWAIVPHLFSAFDSFAFDFLPNIMVPLDNFISRSPALFMEFNFTPQIITMFQKTMEHSSEPACLIASCQLIEVLIQHFKGRMDNYIQGIFEITLNKMQSDNDDHISLSSILLNNMSNIMYYNAGMFFQLSEGHQATVYIFKRYFDLYSEFTRVYEHKLSILALSSIFTLPLIPPLILQSIDKIFLMILSLIERVQLIREKKKSFEEGDREEEEEDFEQEDVRSIMKKVKGLAGSDEDINYNEDDVNINLARAALLEDDDDDELEDEDEVTTFIDPMDEISYFFDCIAELKRINGQLLEQIILALPHDSKINLQLLSEENERKKQNRQ